MEIIHNVDIWILNFINNNLHNSFMDKLMIFFSSIGNSGLIWILISLILIAMPKYRKIGIMALCTLILTTILGEVILKNLVKRGRPFTTIIDFKLLVATPSSYSFPSGHTGSSFAVAGILANKLKKSRFYVYALATLIAFSRLYLYVHYPSDILGGIILGSVSDYIILYIFNNRS